MFLENICFRKKNREKKDKNNNVKKEKKCPQICIELQMEMNGLIMACSDKCLKYVILKMKLFISMSGHGS